MKPDRSRSATACQLLSGSERQQRIEEVNEYSLTSRRYERTKRRLKKFVPFINSFLSSIRSFHQFVVVFALRLKTSEVYPVILLTRRSIKQWFITKGLSNKVIAQTLSLSDGTVKVHISNILSKLHVTSRTEAALWAVQMGLEQGIYSHPGQPHPDYWS
jgi:DNA-binding NarL/FixJ family response regulator